MHVNAEETLRAANVGFCNVLLALVSVQVEVDGYHIFSFRVSPFFQHYNSVTLALLYSGAGKCAVHWHKLRLASKEYV